MTTDFCRKHKICCIFKYSKLFKVNQCVRFSVCFLNIANFLMSINVSGFQSVSLHSISEQEKLGSYFSNSGGYKPNSSPWEPFLIRTDSHTVYMCGNWRLCFYNSIFCRYYFKMYCIIYLFYIYITLATWQVLYTLGLFIPCVDWQNAKWMNEPTPQ
jgi:hypothetical protein